MADLTARPEPLRVPVGEVLARTSLLTPLPPTTEQPATLIVVQRAVRFISDAPPSMPAPSFGSPTLIDELKLGLEGVTTHEFEAAIEGAFSGDSIGPPPQAVEFDDALEPMLEAALAYEAPPAAAEPAESPVESIADAIDAALADASALNESDRPADDSSRPSEPPALDDLAHVAPAHSEAAIVASQEAELAAPAVAEFVPEAVAPAAAANERTASALEADATSAADTSIEIEIATDDVPSPETLQATDGEAAEHLRTESYADELSDAALADALAYDARTEPRRSQPGFDGHTVPPPAPPQALRRSIAQESAAPAASAPAAKNVPGQERPSGEFEELDVEAVAELRAVRAVQEARAGRTNGPPPPPPTRNLPSEPETQTSVRAPRIEDLRPSRPRAQAWWEQFFDDDYLRTVRPPTREQVARQVDFVERRLGLKPGAAVLDVGCGLGLQVLELNARGYVGVGLDLSLPMLTRAAEEAQARAVRVNFLHGDMREMVFDAAFDAVVCLGTTFGYFDDDNNKRALERLYRALKPGGALLIDVVNRDHVLSSQPNLVWFEGDGCVCMEETELNYFTSRLHVKRTVIHDTGKQTENEYGLRLYSLHELGQLLNGAGFRVVEVSGRETVPGVFFGQESPNLLIVAQRRVAPEAPAVPNTEG